MTKEENLVAQDKDDDIYECSSALTEDPDHLMTDRKVLFLTTGAQPQHHPLGFALSQRVPGRVLLRGP